MKKAIKILLLTDGLVILAGAMLGPLYAVFVERSVGGDLLTAGSSWGVFSIVTGLVILLIGKTEDHLKETELAIAAGYLIISFGFLGYLFVDTVWKLFIIQIILGIGEAISLPAYGAVYSSHLTAGKFAFEWGSWEAMRSIVVGLGALAGGIIVSIFNFSSLFIWMFILTFVSGLIIIFLPRKVL